MDVGGGTAQPQQTTTSNLSEEQQKILKYAMPGIKSFAAEVPKRYQGSAVAGFDPAQLAGQDLALGAASGDLFNLGQSGAEANQFLLGDIWNPSTNPNLQGAIDAAVRPITESYQQVVRPAIRDEFIGRAGQQFGGSRRELTEGQAANAYLRNVGDTSSKLANDLYSTNIGAQIRALGLLPYTQSAVLQPALTTSGVGDVRQALEQARLSEGVANWNYDQLAPFLQSKELISLLSGIPGGSITSTANLPPQNRLASGIGGAASGAALGNMLFPGVGALPGAGIGALLSFLG